MGIPGILISPYAFPKPNNGGQIRVSEGKVEKISLLGILSREVLKNYCTGRLNPQELVIRYGMVGWVVQIGVPAYEQWTPSLGVSAL